MNLTRTSDSNNMTWIEYNSTGFDNQGNCDIYIDKYYIPKFGIIHDFVVCSVPREMLTVSNVSQLASSSTNGAISPYCRLIYPVGTPLPVASVNHVYNLTIANITYPIKYGFLDNNGTVMDMTADPYSKSISVTIKDYYDNSSDQERLFSIEFPRIFFNDNMSSVPPGCTEISNGYCVSTIGLSDIPFTVVVKNNATYFGPHVSGELSGNLTRTISTSYPSGITEIQITGNYLMPEFGSGYVVTVVITTTLALTIGVRLITRVKGSRLT